MSYTLGDERQIPKTGDTKEAKTFWVCESCGELREIVGEYVYTPSALGYGKKFWRRGFNFDSILCHTCSTRGRILDEFR